MVKSRGLVGFIGTLVEEEDTVFFFNDRQALTLCVRGEKFSQTYFL